MSDILETLEEKVEFPWRFDAQGKRLSGDRGVEEKEEYEARVRKDAAFEAGNQERWDRWNRSLPEGKELTDEEIDAMIAADQGTVAREEAGVSDKPVVETKPKEEFRAGNRTDEELAEAIYGKNKR